MGILDIFIELVFRKMIVRFFGYYSLVLLFKFTGDKESLKTIKSQAALGGNDFYEGCAINVSGFISFTIFFIALAKLVSLFL